MPGTEVQYVQRLLHRLRLLKHAATRETPAATHETGRADVLEQVPTTAV